MKTILKIFLWALGALAVYLIGGIILSDFVFPPEKPDFATYFQPGDRFISNSEGFDQTVVSTADGWLHLMLEARPMAPGPPVHLHEHLDEKFYVKSGALSILVNGEKKVLGPGESITVPRLTPHQPFNETTGTVVVVSDEDTKTVSGRIYVFSVADISAGG